MNSNMVATGDANIKIASSHEVETTAATFDVTEPSELDMDIANAEPSPVTLDKANVEPIRDEISRGDANADPGGDSSPKSKVIHEENSKTQQKHNYKVQTIFLGVYRSGM